MLWRTVLPSLWVVSMVAAITALIGWCVGLLWYMLRAIPIVRCLAHLFTFFIFLPLTIVHELSHALLLMLAGFKIKRINLFPKVTEQGIELGSVEAAGTGELKFAGYAYLAPLLVGSALLALYMRFAFDIPWTILLESPRYFFNTLFDVIRLVIKRGNLFTIYGLFMLGNATMPSQPDWQEACKLLAAIVLTMVIASAATAVVAFKLISDPRTWEWWLAALNLLAVQFTVIAALDLLVYLILLIPGSIAKLFFGRPS